MRPPASSLRIGERVVARCDDGLFEAEYVLFRAEDIALRAADPVTVREEGYITSASLARERLAEAGVGVQLAEAARAAVRAEVARSYARGAAAASIAPELGAYELFEGGAYEAATQRYDGVWLDLRSLAEATKVERAAIALQALHLAAVLAEVPDDAPVHLSTRGALDNRRPAERTYRRVRVAHAYDLPGALEALAPRADQAAIDSARDEARRAELVARLRARSASASDAERARIEALERELSSTLGTRGPLSAPELRAIDTQLGAGDATGVADRLDELVRGRGETPALVYLRARLALLVGSEAPRAIAESVSRLSGGDQAFHEAVLLASRAWLAAGDEGHARYFARALVDDATAPDGVRLVALEIVDSTQATSRSSAPPPVVRETSPPEVAYAAPPGASMPPYESGAPPPVATPSTPPVSARPWVREPVTLVETLALPPGSDESMLEHGKLPRTPREARIAFTRIARDVAQGYRLYYGTTLRTDMLAVDAMQRHLRARFGGAAASEPALRRELYRHGALLSELLARMLGASWVDVSPSEAGYWAMFVPPSTRTFPIGRVHRFFSLGSQEKDLVGYVLELEARARGA